MIYVINILSIVVYYNLIKHIKGKHKDRTFLIICTIQMSLIAGLRYEVGADYGSYDNIFGQIASGNASKVGAEVGYKMLNVLVAWLGGNYNTLNIVVAFLTFGFLAWAVSRSSKDIFYSIYLYIALFFFYFAMNQTRQQLAIAIGIFALTFLEKDDIKWFVFWIVIAALFHTSILVFLVLIVLKNIKIGKRVFTVYAAGTVGMWGMMEIINIFLKYTRYAIYFNLSYYRAEITVSMIVNSAVRVVLLLLVLWRERYVEESSKKNIWYHMALICTMLQILTMNNPLFGRITTNFFIVYIFLIPEIIQTLRRRYRKLIWEAGIVVGGIYNYVYYYFMGSSVLVNEYHSIFYK